MTDSEAVKCIAGEALTNPNDRSKGFDKCHHRACDFHDFRTKTDGQTPADVDDYLADLDALADGIFEWEDLVGTSYRGPLPLFGTSSRGKLEGTFQQICRDCKNAFWVGVSDEVEFIEGQIVGSESESDYSGYEDYEGHYAYL